MSQRFLTLGEFLREGPPDAASLLAGLSREGGFEWDESAFRLERPGKTDLSAVAVDGEGLVGYAVASRKPPAVHVHQIVVRKGGRSAGTGRALMERVRAGAEAAGATAVTVKVAADNERALAFYRRLSFETIDRAAGSDGTYRKLQLRLRPARYCAVHQPNFLPHLGYFGKLMRSDVFVLLDDVQVPRGGSFANRNRVLTPNGPQWLTLPLERPKGRGGKMTYREARVRLDVSKAKILSTLRAHYARAPFFEETLGLIEGAMSGETLAEVGGGLVRAVAGHLGLDRSTRIALQSALPGIEGRRSAMIASICRAVDATHYLSGSGGGRAYNDETVLGEEGNVIVAYDHFVAEPYEQRWTDEFVPNLSVVDVLMNVGAEGARELLGYHHQGSQSSE